MAQAMSADVRRIRRRLSAIERRLSELSDMWDFACDTDAQYRMVEAERKALRQEREMLKEIKGDL
jgi:hypothetical protein